MLVSRAVASKKMFLLAFTVKVRAEDALDDTTAFAAAAATEGANDYIPEKQKEKIVAFIKLLGPNETAEVTFTAPTTPGEYPFLCTFPAHCAIGMKGVLVVKK